MALTPCPVLSRNASFLARQLEPSVAACTLLLPFRGSDRVLGLCLCSLLCELLLELFQPTATFEKQASFQKQEQYSEQ